MQFDVWDMQTKRSLLAEAVVCRKPGLLRVLIDSGADLNRRDAQGRSAFMLAVVFGNREAFDMLVECEGMDMDMQDSDGNTALILALKS